MISTGSSANGRALDMKRVRKKAHDHGPQWVAKEGKKDGFTSTLIRMVSILPERKPLWGGPCQKVERGGGHPTDRGEGERAGPGGPGRVGERNR